MKLLTSLLNVPYQAFKIVEGVDVYHYTAPPTKEAPYAIWQEEADDSFNADNRKTERSLSGILDYYTLNDGMIDGNLDALEDAMQTMGATWQLTAVQYEDSTNLIHFSWDWSVT